MKVFRESLYLILDSYFLYDNIEIKNKVWTWMCVCVCVYV